MKLVESISSIGQLFVDNLCLYDVEINRFVITDCVYLSLLVLLLAGY